MDLGSGVVTAGIKRL